VCCRTSTRDEAIAKVVQYELDIVEIFHLEIKFIKITTCRGQALSNT